jgi:hypothetical protein
LRDPTPKNIAVSIRQKLQNLAEKRNDDFGLVLTKYGLERILFRLSKSKYRDTFILKGALLFEVWTAQRHRPTRDADFLAAGDRSPQRFVQIFRELSAFEFPHDALRFDGKTIKAGRIKENADYSGVRVTLTAFLEKSRIPIQIDVAFGDKVTPGSLETDYPTLLDLPGPPPFGLPARNGSFRKTGSDCKTGNHQHPHERLPRFARTLDHVLVRRKNPRRCHPRHIQATRHRLPRIRCSSRVHCGVFCRRKQDQTVARVL